MLNSTDVFAYAVNGLNEPDCANIALGSNSTATGPWSVTPSGLSNSEYLTADLVGTNVTTQGVSVVFEPDIKQKGNYSVTIFTPGCLQDNSCASRGIANVTGNFTATSAPGIPLSMMVYQTNNYDKYDQVYQGPVDLNSDGFRPTVTLTPGQNSSMTLVAQRVQFTLKNSTGGLNGLFEFDPNSNTIDTDFSNSPVDQAGMNLDLGAIVTSIAVLNDVTYVGGNFSDSSNGFENVFSIGPGNATALPNGGLNAEVSTIATYEDLLFIGGNFTNTMNGSVAGLNNVAIYNTTSRTWQALGAGVNGPVDTIVSLEVNVTTNKPETCITVNGFFDQLIASGSNNNVSVNGFGIWVPSRQNWLQNLHLQSQAISGQLSASTNVTNSTPLLSGTLSSQDMSAEDAVSLTSNPLAVNALNVGIQPQQIGPLTRKRAISGQNVSGVVTGLFHAPLPLNVTILGGHFTATASNGSMIDNLAFLNNTGGASTITGLPMGLDPDSSFLALETSGSVLYAGGSITGTVNGGSVNGLVVYDLGQADFSYPQPSAFGGSDVAVNAITVRPNNNAQVFVGGSFDTGGSLSCPGVCIFQNGAWSQPGSGIGGSASAFMWQGNDQLLVGGNLTVNNNATYLATYDAAKTQWSALSGAASNVSGPASNVPGPPSNVSGPASNVPGPPSNAPGSPSNVPGPVTALSPANSGGTEFWVAGKSANGSAFLMKYDGSQFRTIGNVLGDPTTILGLSVLSLSKPHAQNELVSPDMTLLVTGSLNLPTFGNVSAALFNGTTFSPFILSSSGNSPGSMSQLFSEKTVNFKSSGIFMLLPQA